MHDQTLDAPAATVEAAPLPLPAGQREPWNTFLRSMFWIGINTFGGPVAQIGVMHQEAVEFDGGSATASSSIC